MDDEDAYEEDVDRILELECELTNAWSTVDQLSDEYIAMWDKLEKLEILLLMQRNVISQLSCIVQEPTATAIDRQQQQQQHHHRRRHHHQQQQLHHQSDPCHWTPIRSRRRARLNELSFTSQQQQEEQQPQPSSSRQAAGVSFDTSFDSSVYHPEPPPPMPPLHADSPALAPDAAETMEFDGAGSSTSDQWMLQGPQTGAAVYSGVRERTMRRERREPGRSKKTKATSLLPEDTHDPKKGLKRQGNIIEHLPLLPRQDEQEELPYPPKQDEERGNEFLLCDPSSQGMSQAASSSIPSDPPAVDINQMLPILNPEMDHKRIPGSSFRRKLKILRRKSIEEVEDEEIEPATAFQHPDDPEESAVFRNSLRKSAGQVGDPIIAPPPFEPGSYILKSSYAPHLSVRHEDRDVGEQGSEEQESRRKRLSIIHDDLDQDRSGFRVELSPSSSPVRDRARSSLSPCASQNQPVQRQEQGELGAGVLVPIEKVDQITAEAGTGKRLAGGTQVVSLPSSLSSERRPSSGPQVLVTEAAIPFPDHPSTLTTESRRSMLITSTEVPSHGTSHPPSASTAAATTTACHMSASSRSPSVPETKKPDPISSLNQSLFLSLTTTVSRGYQNVLSLQAQQQQHQQPLPQQQSRRMSSGSSITSSLGGFFKNVPFVTSSTAPKPQPGNMPPSAAMVPDGRQDSLTGFGTSVEVKTNDHRDEYDRGSSVLVTDERMELASDSRNESSSHSASDGNALSRNSVVQYLTPCDVGGGRRKGSRGEDQFLTTTSPGSLSDDRRRNMLETSVSEESAYKSAAGSRQSSFLQSDYGSMDGDNVSNEQQLQQSNVCHASSHRDSLSPASVIQARIADADDSAFCSTIEEGNAEESEQFITPDTSPIPAPTEPSGRGMDDQQQQVTSVVRAIVQQKAAAATEAEKRDSTSSSGSGFQNRFASIMKQKVEERRSTSSSSMPSSPAVMPPSDLSIDSESGRRDQAARRSTKKSTDFPDDSIEEVIGEEMDEQERTREQEQAEGIDESRKEERSLGAAVAGESKDQVAKKKTMWKAAVVCAPDIFFFFLQSFPRRFRLSMILPFFILTLSISMCMYMSAPPPKSFHLLDRIN